MQAVAIAARTTKKKAPPVRAGLSLSLVSLPAVPLALVAERSRKLAEWRLTEDEPSTGLAYRWRRLCFGVFDDLPEELEGTAGHVILAQGASPPLRRSGAHNHD